MKTLLNKISAVGVTVVVSLSLMISSCTDLKDKSYNTIIARSI